MVYISPVLAQNPQPTSLRNVILSVYPEYDAPPYPLGDPAVLVMLEGEVLSDSIPAEIHFMVPSDAVMYSAGSGPRTQYKGGPPYITPSNVTGWNDVSYNLTTKYFVLEYYAPIAGQPDRVISYDFRPMYPVSGLTAIVQEPRNSTNFTVAPQGPISTDGEGFRVHNYNYATVSPDVPLHFDISYTKANTDPSKGSSSSAGSPNTTVLIVLVVIVILIGGFILVSKLKSRRPATRSLRRQAARASQRGQKSSKSSKSKYCSKCGKSTDSSSRFCAYCGNELN
jgi:hypothetical protein